MLCQGDTVYPIWCEHTIYDQFQYILQPVVVYIYIVITYITWGKTHDSSCRISRYYLRIPGSTLTNHFLYSPVPQQSQVWGKITTGKPVGENVDTYRNFVPSSGESFEPRVCLFQFLNKHLIVDTNEWNEVEIE